MNKQQLLWLGIAVVVILAVLLIINSLGGSSREVDQPISLTTSDIDLQGQVTDVSRGENTFTLTQLRPRDTESEEPLITESYAISWDEGTQFFLFETQEQVAAGTPLIVEPSRLRQDAVVMVDARESEGETRTAARIFILGEALQGEAQ